MDILRRWRSHFLLPAFQKRLPRFQIRGAFSGTDPEKVKIARGFVLVVVSLAFAWTSVKVTEETNLLHFRDSEWPSPKLWQLTLHQYGLQPAPRLGDYALSLRSHPAPYSDESQIWVNDDHCLVYVTHSPFQKDQNPELWSCNSSVPRGKTQWSGLGSGLNGIHRLVDWFEKTGAIIGKNPAPARNIIDPKEIRY